MYILYVSYQLMDCYLVSDSTPVLPSRSSGSRSSDHGTADIGQVQLEMHDQKTQNNNIRMLEASTDPQTSDTQSQDHSINLSTDVNKHDTNATSQHSPSLPQSNQGDEEPENETVSKTRAK